MPAQRHEPQDIRDYSDYRTFLGDRYRSLKAADRRFSHRYLAQKAGAQSSGWFADVLAGRQSLKARYLAPLASALRLEGREREFLQTLLEMENAETAEQRAAAYEKWLHLKGVRQETLRRDQLQYFDHWYYAVLREWLLIQPAEGLKTLATRLDPPITAREAGHALSVLKRLGLLLPGAPPVLVKDPTLKSAHWKQLQKDFTRLALSALERFSKEERDFSALTLAFSPEGLKKAGEEISALRKRLLILSERDRDKDRVYQCLFQVFPLSRSAEKKNG